MSERSTPTRKTYRYGLLAAAALFLGAHVADAAPLALKICSIDDRTGAAADTGNESFGGVSLAVDAANAKGGINGQKVELVVYDGKTDPALTATLATRCAEDDKGLMIIGGNPTAPAAAMIPVAAQFQIPFYMMSASADNLTDGPPAWHFRFGPRNAQDAIAMSDVFAAQGFKKVGLIHNQVPFGTDGARALSEALKKKGIEVVTDQTYDIAATDISPQVLNLRIANPQIVAVFGYPADAARVIRTMQQLGMKAPTVIVRVGVLATTRKLAAAAADGMLVPTTVDITRPEVKQLFDDYNARFAPVQPSPYVVIGYDGATLALKVLATPEVQKAVAAGDLAGARKAIREQTEKLGQFQGMQGAKGMTYQFSASQHHGPPDIGTFVFTEVSDNGTKLVPPDMSKFKPQ